VISHLVLHIELLHFIERLIRCHNDIDILEVVEISQKSFRLMLAMLAIRTKEHDDRPAPLLQIGRS